MSVCVAKSILDAGGDEIQDECDAHVKAEGPLYEGECYSGNPGSCHVSVLFMLWVLDGILTNVRKYARH